MALAAILLAAATAIAAPLPPTGPWVVEAGEDMCLLSHAFGAGPDKITVGFQPMFKQETMEIIVLSPITRVRGQRVGYAKLAFGPGGKSMSGSYYSVELPQKNTRVTRVTVDSEAFEQLRTASSLSIKASPIDATVEIRSPAKALTTFDTCQKDLLTSWGVDPASLEGDRAPKPRTQMHRLFTSSDYPQEAIRAGISGRVVTVLQVTPQGTVSGCRVVASAGTALNERTCEVVRRATFYPAHDGEGKPAPSIYVIAVRWMAYGG